MILSDVVYPTLEEFLSVAGVLISFHKLLVFIDV
mgnify:CR=1 FL=1